ncbi:hypothetical protein SAMN05444166_2819 [Singulisphaera sp. GP187]|nr:hypothetical protein SAMN05444166_2819 [Singulisphaera sp. GP187]
MCSISRVFMRMGHKPKLMGRPDLLLAVVAKRQVAFRTLHAGRSMVRSRVTHWWLGPHGHQVAWPSTQEIL